MATNSTPGWQRESLVVAGFMLLFGPILHGFLAAFHPLLPWAAAIALIAAGISGGSASFTDTDRSERTNCSNCGARVPAARPECEYCGEPFDSSGAHSGDSNVSG